MLLVENSNVNAWIWFGYNPKKMRRYLTMYNYSREDIEIIMWRLFIYYTPDITCQ